MTPFLQQIAALYTVNARTAGRTLFVFPNKRSATFFRQYYSELSSGRYPAVATISSFISSLTDLRQASALESVFCLYREYCTLSGETPEFDRFMFWAEMIVNDFNDVDRYLVDPDSLFVNVQRFKEIGSNYLTPEQTDIIRRYWGEEPGHSDAEHFWEHTGAGAEGKPSGEFIRLWELLAPLYHAWHSALERSGRTAAGMMWRKGAQRVGRLIEEDALDYDRYVFIGFNVLTPAEIKIFSLLRDCGHADFYWDYNSPAFTGGFNRAGRFIENNIRLFPSIYPLPEEKITELPEIEITGVASDTGQAKLTGEILDRFVAEGAIADPANAIDTAVVLPDEGLFTLLRRSIPPSITSTNVTMGLPMKATPLAALMRLVVIMQAHLRRSGAGEFTFFHGDVRAVAANPAVRAIAPEEARLIVSTIEDGRLFRVPASTLAGAAPTLAPLFAPLPESAGPEEVLDYISGLTSMLREGADGNNLRFIDSYMAAVDRVWRSLQAYRVRVNRSTFFRMIERIVAQSKIPLVGEPLRGLQVMGVLETRALDFDNIIMLSMNERIFPRKRYSGSFIPDALRKGYGMATTDFQESVFAYYFYRLISRAKKVRLIYDARSIGLKSGEMSRYLTQLLHLHGGPGSRVRRSMRVFPPVIVPAREATVAKTPRILALLEDFRSTGPDARFLSATALNTYIACPLQFYLRFVEGYDPDKEMKEYIDSGEYGTLLHDCLHTLYSSLSSRARGGAIPPREMAALLSPADTTVGRIIVRAVNRIYLRRPQEALDTPLAGESLVMANVMRASILEILRNDAALDSLTFVSGEESMKVTLPMPDGRGVNFRQFIDRIDRVGTLLRIVDYKTGKEKNSAASVEACFDPNCADRPKAVFQLLLYCYAYSLATGNDGPIKPVIYCLPKITREGPLEVKFDKQVLEDYRSVRERFVSLLQSVISEIFDPAVPFRHADSDHSCLFCSFKPLCGRDY